MLAVTGRGTSIVQALTTLTGEAVERIHADLADPECKFILPPDCDRFVLAAGVLYPKRILELESKAIAESINVNLVNVVRLTETILRTRPRGRVVIIGSVSAREGSFDECYAIAKAGVHAYTAFRLVQPPQLLYCVAPTIVSDAGMTLRRADYPGVLRRRPTVTSAEVARAIADALYAPEKDLERMNNAIRFLEGAPT